MGVHLHLGTGVYIAIALVVLGYILGWPQWGIALAAFIAIIMLTGNVWLALIGAVIFWRYG